MLHNYCSRTANCIVINEILFRVDVYDVTFKWTRTKGYLTSDLVNFTIVMMSYIKGQLYNSMNCVYQVISEVNMFIYSLAVPFMTQAPCIC